MGIKVRAALAAADRKTGQGVLEGLLEAQELDNALVDGRMETKSALVRSDRAVELDAEAAVDVDLSLIILPRNTELDGTLRLDQGVHDTFSDQFRTCITDRGEGS